MPTQSNQRPRPLCRGQFKRYVLWLRQPPYESWVPILTGDCHEGLIEQALATPSLMTEAAETLITPIDDPRDGQAVSKWANALTLEKAEKVIQETGWWLALQYADNEAVRQRLIELGEDMLIRLRNPIESPLAETAV